MQRRNWDNSIYGLHNGPVVTARDGIDVIECEQCGYKHVVPLPSPETQAEFYEEAFYQDEKSNYIEEASEDFAWKAVECELRYSIASELLEGAKGRVLDIGSGPGDFLAVGTKLGWLGSGIEPSPLAARHARARGLDVQTGFFDEQSARSFADFDFVHLSEVLEHVARPEELLKLAFQTLRPGGVLCVSVPNDYNSLQEIITKKHERTSWWVVPDHHLNYFNFDTLSELITACGFDVCQTLTNFPMELFLLMGQDYTSDPARGRELHGWRKTLDINLANGDISVMRRFYEGLAEAGLGRLAIVFARKPQEDAGEIHDR